MTKTEIKIISMKPQYKNQHNMGIKNWSLCIIKQITNLKIAEYFLKKWVFIVAITSQRHLPTFFPTTKLHISAMFHFICTLYSALVQVNKDLFYQRITRVHKYFLLENLFLAHYTGQTCFLIKSILPSLSLTYLEMNLTFSFPR